MTGAIRPTHTCFDDALDLMAFFVEQDPKKIHTLMLVHAICLAPEGPSEGRPFAHAWLEDGDLAWQAGFLGDQKVQFSCDKAQLAETLRVQKATRYTVREAHEHNVRTSHYGPWEDEYQALCNRAPTPETFEEE